MAIEHLYLHLCVLMCVSGCLCVGGVTVSVTTQTLRSEDAREARRQPLLTRHTTHELREVCESCPPGNHLVEWCSPHHHTTLCAPCPPNTFRPHPNFHLRCKRLRHCVEVRQAGNATHNNICKPQHHAGLEVRGESPDVVAEGYMQRRRRDADLTTTPLQDTSTDADESREEDNAPNTTQPAFFSENTTSAFEADINSAIIIAIIVAVVWVAFILCCTPLLLRYRHAMRQHTGAKIKVNHLTERKRIHADKTRKTGEMEPERSISLHFCEMGNANEKVMATNEAFPRIHMNPLYQYNSRLLSPNLDAQIMKDNDFTKIKVLKRSCSDVKIQHNFRQEVPYDTHSIDRSWHKRRSGRFLAGYEKRQMMVDCQIVPFIQSLSKSKQAFTEVEISLRNDRNQKKVKESLQKTDIKEVFESGTGAECAPGNDRTMPDLLGRQEDTSESHALLSAHSATTSAQTSASNLDFTKRSTDHLVCEVSKESKINNCNIYMDKPDPEGRSSDEPPPEDGDQSRVFDSRGGQWSVPESAVQLTVPEGAVPPNACYSVDREVITDLARFSKYLTENERFVAPIAQFVCEKKFVKHVKVDIPHCLKNWANVHIQWGDTMKDIPFRDVPGIPKDNNIIADVYFTIGPESISIYTKHFTQFLCSEVSAIPYVHGAHDVQLEALVLGKQSVTEEEQELHLKLYIIDSLYRIIDMRKHISGRCKNFPLECEYSLKALPNTISGETDVTMTLSPKGDWTPQTKADGQPVELLHQTSKLSFLQCSQVQYMPVAAAEFILVLPRSQSATHFKGDLQISVCEKREQKKKTSFWPRLKRVSEKEGKQEEGLECTCTNTMWLNFPFQQVFNKAPRRALHCEEDVLQYIAAELPRASVKPLLRKLGLKETDWEQIQNSHRDDLREQKLQLLLLYRERQGPAFCVDHVIRSLDYIGDSNLSDDVKVRWTTDTCVDMIEE